MIDVNSMLVWQKFNAYNFVEKTHQYFYYDKPVKYSVTQFLSRFSPPFDSEGISKKYAEKHKLSQQDVLAEWKRKGDISTTAGTIIHSYMENAKRGKTFEIDYSVADSLGIRKEVEERVSILLPQAEAFHKDTLNKLFPLQLEYTVGIEHYIAGNIDMVCWNARANEFQIWDYKNVKSINQIPGYFDKWCYKPFNRERDTNYIHYSMQLYTYKEILERTLPIKIGGCYLVQFCSEKNNNGFEIFPCRNLQRECAEALDSLIREEKLHE